MRVLALDTSTWRGEVALVETTPGGPRVTAETTLKVRDSHAVHLLDLIDAVLADAGWTKAGLDGFVAIRGPGSFTGIRIGLGLVGGLALGAERPCAGVNTLEAMAEAHGAADRERVPLLSAGRGEVYGARYDAISSPPGEVEPPWVGRAERVLDDPTALLICATGCEPDPARPRPPASWVRSAPGTAAAAGRIVLLRGDLEREPAAGLSPLYLRPSDAELKTGRA